VADCVHLGESPEEAVRRELREESGIEDAVMVRKLGETWYMAERGNVPVDLEEQIQHAFHLRLENGPIAEDHNYIGTEHLLLGLLHEHEGVAAQALASFDVTLAGVRVRVVELIGRGSSRTTRSSRSCSTGPRPNGANVPHVAVAVRCS
jgi:8-oxo-dGTP pyrophosphatase MutT (NUDIX family)